MGAKLIRNSRGQFRNEASAIKESRAIQADAGRVKTVCGKSSRDIKERLEKQLAKEKAARSPKAAASHKVNDGVRKV